MSGISLSSERRGDSIAVVWPTGSGEPVGSAFLIDARHIMTCAHVVGQAVGGGREADARAAAAAPIPPPDIIKVTFPLLAPGKFLKAKAVPAAWRPRLSSAPPPEHCDDVAVLELCDGEELPAGARPVPLCQQLESGDEFIAHSALAGGRWARGSYIEALSPFRLQVTSAHVDLQIRGGCSGGAAWNASGEGGGVFGMVVELQDTMSGRVIPIAELQKIWPFGPEPHAVAAPGAPPGGSSTHIPRQLLAELYTFDRESQVTDFNMHVQALWSESMRSVVAVIAGETEDKPELCIDCCIRRTGFGHRLDHMQIDPAILEKRKVKIAWPERVILGKRHLESLKNQVGHLIKAAGKAGRNPDAADFRKALNDSKQPWVFYSEIKPMSFPRKQWKLAGDWIAFWQEIAAERIDHPVAVFLLLTLDASVADGPGKFYEHLFKTTGEKSPQCLSVLQQLDTQHSHDDLRKWLRDKAGTMFTDDDVDLQIMPGLQLKNYFRLGDLHNRFQGLKL